MANPAAQQLTVIPITNDPPRVFATTEGQVFVDKQDAVIAQTKINVKLKLLDHGVNENTPVDTLVNTIIDILNENA